MTTPGTPDPSQPDGYQPPGYQPPDGYPPPGYQPPGGYPQPGYEQPGGYLQPGYGHPGGYLQPGYPPQPGYPLQGPDGAYPPPDRPPYAAPPAYGTQLGFPPPPVSPGKKSKKGLIIGIIAVVVIGIIGITVVVQNKTATTSASVGSCIKITSATIVNPDTSQEDCSSAAAIFVVTETGGSDVQCDPNEVSYVQGKKTDDPSSRVCLRYNLKVGECLDPGDGVSSVPKKVACSAAQSNTAIRLVALITDSADESKCPSGSTGLALVKRNMVYCVTAVS